ncbi:MAG: T9SS type A sorting domain-containing protein [Bacteroidia bacterium]
MEEKLTEVHGLVYVLIHLCFHFHQSVFVHYRIFNRQQVPLSNMYLGMWTDYDIGNFADDHVGCDTLLNASYGYNATNNDMAGSYGYGAGPPSVATLFLNQPMTTFAYYDNDFSSTGNPSVPRHYYNYLQGLWTDNIPMTVGGTGYDPFIVNPVTTFMFPGDPVADTGWVAADAGQPGGADRRGLTATGPFDLAADSSVCLDVGFIWARDKTGTHLTSLSLMKSRIVEAQNYYLAQNYSCYDTLTAATRIASVQPLKGIAVYPNPFTNELRLEMAEPPVNPLVLTVYNIQGKRIWCENIPLGTTAATILVPDIPAGMYIVEVRSGNHYFRKKLIKP